ncbi:ABC transporter permease [Paenibacillus senegalensis]|uniref:ABC transporter permease n=1 Tax=Paenibacillus senegalensis TaxID=1465766 RepID=UPI0002895858|nr:ABC transporter permease [Paenibacillus senegalensis]
MLELMKLELRKINIRTYIHSTFIIFIALLGFIYLLAYIPRVNPSDPNLELFGTYKNIVSLFGALSMAVFCVSASVMYSRFVIEEYTGKRVILLFTYPTSREKMFFSKMMIVTLFTILSMLLCTILIYLIFGLSETFFPLVKDTITYDVISKAITTTMIMTGLAAGLSIISVTIGFIRKSTPAAIVSAILLCSMVTHISSGTLNSNTAAIIFMAITILAAIYAVKMILKKINGMEV